MPARVPIKERMLGRRRIDSRGCWRFQGPKTEKGYGLISEGGRHGLMRRVHRVAYEIYVGPIPEGTEIDHRCHTPDCFNPNHLREATRGQNLQNREGATKASKSGVRGVHWSRSRNQWIGQAKTEEKRFYGYFTSKQEADQAVRAWREENMSFSNERRKEIAP